MILFLAFLLPFSNFGIFSNDFKQRENEDNEDSESIIHKAAEFLFDVWDANCIEEFKRIEAFENRAWGAFDSDAKEYTLEQKVRSTMD